LIKVLNVISDANIGGAGHVLINFLKHSDRSAFSHTVALPENAALIEPLRGLGVEVVEVGGIAAKSASLKAVGGLREMISRLEPDVVHTHASLSARIAARQWGKCAIVHTRHSAYPQGLVKTMFPVKQVLGFINNRYSDIIIAVSPAARDNLTDTGTDLGKIVIVYNGVEPMRRLAPEEKAAARAELGIREGEFVCTIAARLVPEKGHAYVLDAAALLRDLPIRFIIAGTGPIEAQLRADAEARGLTCCIFTGFVEDVARIMNITDVQLNASYGTEATSLAILEGMSLGIPAVASDYGGNPYIVEDGENGLIVPQRNAKAMADTIRAFYDDSKMRALMGQAAFGIYGRRFTAEIMTAGIEKVYREVL
jgi:glycosyltransferase involved in cell wall biosynthesis